MKGSGKGHARRRVSLLALVGLAAAVALAASASVSAGQQARSLGAAPGRLSLGVLHYSKPIVPRVVHPRKGPHGKVQPGKAVQHSDVEAEVPPSLGGGTPAHGLPPIVSDGRPGTTHRSGAARMLTPSGSFTDLLTLKGATFSNTCVVQTDGSCQGAEPPDTQMAAGQNEIVEAVNNNLFVFSRGGTQLATYPLTQIFQPPNTTVGLTDPKILFDPTTGDYYMTEMVCEGDGCGASDWTHMGISLAISSNPQVGWSVYDYLNDGQDLQDQEKLGFSGDKITFAVNEYGCKCGSGSKFKQENVVVIQKSDAVAGNPVTPTVYSANSYSSYIFDSMPTTPVNASTSDNTQYVVWDKQQTSSNQMAVIRITGTPNAHDVDFTGSVTTIGIANQTAPPAPVQPGGTIAGDKQNFQSAMVQGNDLWAVATDGCTPQYPSTDTATRDCTRLVEVDLGSNSVVTDTDIGTDGTYRYNPSVSKDSDGHVFFGFTISSSTQYATAAIDGSSVPLPAVLQRMDYASGDATYTGGRWGDYSGTQQDPADTHDVWSAQEFGACITGCNNYNFGGNWATELGQFTFRDPHITSISPTQGPVLGGTSVDIYGSEFADGGTTVMFGPNASSNVTWFDSTHIRAVSPPGSVGTVDVTATTGAGTSDTSPADQFTYFQVPTTTTYTGPTNGDYNDPVTLSARLTSNLDSSGVAGKTLTFTLGAETCFGVTDAGGNASCNVLPLDDPGPYTVDVSFAGDSAYLPSSDAQPFTINQEESRLTYTGVLTSHYHDQFTVSATLTDPDGGAPIAGKPVTFTLGGTESCSGTTDAAGNVSCQITSSQTGSKSLVVSFAGDTDYLPSTNTQTFSITPEETTITYTGPTVILAGASGTTLTAKLVEDGTGDTDGDGGSPGPIPAELVTLSVGSQSCTATTDASGNVSCTIPSVSVPLGPETVGAAFAGDAYYQAAAATKSAIVFAFPTSGAFALGDLSVASAGPSTTLTWWGNNWYLLNSLSGGTAPPPFKGFVASVTLPNTTPPNVCSGNWTTSGGNSPPPPATVPSYMGVIVSSKITKSGNTISGDYAKIVVVKTDPGYAPGPQNAGTGTIVATFCG
jgi:IPT/TIG domain